MSVSLRTETAAATVTAPTMPTHVRALTWCLGTTALVTAALTLFLPDVLTGPAVTNANARGTSLVMIVLGVPLLLVSSLMTGRGSWRAHLVWIGIVVYLTYNGFMFLFATPFNRLFLLYVATFSLGLFTLGSLLIATRPASTRARLGHLPARGLAVYSWVIVLLNVLVWMRGIVPALLDDDPMTVLVGSGVATNPVWIQDLAFWLPMAALAAWWLWQGKAWGYVLIGAWLVYGLVESIGVAVDQAMGHAADPGSPHASIEGMVIFIALALIGLIPLYFYLRPGSETADAGASGQSTRSTAFPLT